VSKVKESRRRWKEKIELLRSAHHQLMTSCWCHTQIRSAKKEGNAWRNKSRRVLLLKIQILSQSIPTSLGASLSNPVANSML